MDMHSPDNAVHENFISGLANSFSKSLHVQDYQKSEHTSEGNDICDDAEENISGSFQLKETKLDTKCLKKSATFPVADTKLPSSSSDEETDTSFAESPPEQSAHLAYARSISLPLPLKLIPATKGSREKHLGLQPKLTVKWAPDVYDPVPTLVSHTVKSRKHVKSRKKKYEKKNGKKGQKGSSSRGGKDKSHQFRKMGGTPDMCYNSLDSHDKVKIEASELGGNSVLDVRCQDSYCGTSFLKTSITEVCFSVAEAQ